MKGWVGLVGWPTLDGLVFTHKRSPVRCRSSAGQRKFAGQIPTFYHCATQPTIVSILPSFRYMTMRRTSEKISYFGLPGLWAVETTKRMQFSLSSSLGTLVFDIKFQTNFHLPGTSPTIGQTTEDGQTDRRRHPTHIWPLRRTNNSIHLYSYCNWKKNKKERKKENNNISQPKSTKHWINKQCGRRVGPTRYAPARLYHWLFTVWPWNCCASRI